MISPTSPTYVSFIGSHTFSCFSCVISPLPQQARSRTPPDKILPRFAPPRNRRLLGMVPGFRCGRAANSGAEPRFQAEDVPDLVGLPRIGLREQPCVIVVEQAIHVGVQCYGV